MTRCYILLGRLGDIISILPMMKLESDAGVKPALMVASEFASVLEGVGYVDPVIYEGHHTEIGKAVDFAVSKGFSPVVLQLIGRRDEVLEKSFEANGIARGTMADSFDKEPWRMAGKFKEWYQLPPLVFDKRDAEREAALLKRESFTTAGKKKPVILLSLESKTSPFPYAALLRRLVTACFPNYRVLDLPKADRIYDLLALYEKAALLIAVDSAPLHLAWACRRLPVFALTQDKPSLWHGSAWRPNHLWYCRYSDWPDRAVEMLDEISRLCERFEDTSILRVFSEYETANTSPISDNVLRFSIGICGRDSGNTIKDTKRVPYLKDCLRMAMQRSIHDNTWIVISRPNVMMDYKDITLKSPPFFAYRVSDHEGHPEFRPVVDLFCATRAWWRTMMKEIPDLLLSNDYAWSQCLWAIFQQAGAKDLTGICYREATKDVKVWNGVETISAKHNSNLCGTYIASSKVRSRYPKVSDQLECLPLETDKLMPFGYNPAISKFGENMLMAYRYHSGGMTTKLAVAGVGFDGNLISNYPLSIEVGSIEDARWFESEAMLKMSFVDSTFPKMPIRAIVRRSNGFSLGMKMERIHQDPLPGNDGSTIQKNWIYFEHDSRLFCIYQCHPVHSVYEIGETNVLHATPPPRWPYGDVRGGTPPIPYEGKLLRFFHSRLMNELGPFHHRYFVGAYLMNPEPPFAVTRVSKKPILYGSEIDGLNKDQRKACKHYKPNCVLPFGVVERDEGWLLSVGVNDSACAIVKVKSENLQL